MSASPRRSILLAAACLTLAATVISPVGADTGDAIGRLIAEHFATGSGKELPAGTARRVDPAPRPAPDDEQRMIEEIDMLERARAEAEARRDALLKEREAAEIRDGAARDAGLQADVERRIADEARRAAEAGEKAAAIRRAEEDRRLADERRRAEEAQRAADAVRKAEDERRIADEARRAAEAEEKAVAGRKAEADRRLADERRRAEEAQRATHEAAKEARELALMEAEREAEAVRIDDALRKARETREAREARPDPSPSEGERWSRSADGAGTGAQPAAEHPDSGRSGERTADGRGDTRVTVLLVMVPGHRGIRRNHKTADPILCAERGCYVSAGPGAPADLFPIRRAFGPGRTLGERAGACRNSLGCVFSNVDLVAYPAVLQPVDMRLVRHDRRQPQVLNRASDCRVDAGRLSCSPIGGPDYTIWVVPQSIADAAGPAELERAVDEGLRPRNTAAWHQVRN